MKKTMVTISFANKKWLIASDLPKRQKYAQDYFISNILPKLQQEKSETDEGNKVKRFGRTWTTQKVVMTGQFKTNSRRKASYAVLSPCEFWFFGMAKEKMKDREFRIIQDILGCLTEVWNDLTFKDVQSVFREWQVRLN
jgi:hypothetical protein